MKLSIGRLTLRLPGLSSLDGERLAKLVRERLSRLQLTDNPANADKVRRSIPFDPHLGLERMADRIVQEIGHSLQQNL